MRKNKIKFENLNSDEQQQVHLENLKSKILECKGNIESNIYFIGLYLSGVKEQLPHGAFGNWIEENLGFTERTARNYMKVYKFQEDFTTCESIEESDKKERIINEFNKGQLMELSKLNKKDACEFINEDTLEELKDLSMEKLNKKIKEFKQSKKTKTESTCRFEEKETTTSPATITTEIIIKTDTNKIFTELCILNGELRNRVGSDEDLETTLVAKYTAKEITHQEFIDVVAKNKLNLPIFFYKEALDDYLDRTDFYSDYEQYDNNQDIKNDRKYYSVFDKDFEWQEAIRCNDKSDEDMVDWSKSNNIDNGTYQFTEAHNSYGDRYLCIYKDYKLLGSFQDGEWKDIDQLGTYDRRNIPTTAMKELETLYNKLEKQIKDYNERSTIRYAKQAKEREKRQKQQKKYDDVMKLWKEAYQPYSMGKWQFSDIWNEKGEINNWNTYREMTDFVRVEKQKKQDKWKDYDFGGMFGGSSSIAVKEEDKSIYKTIYRSASLKLHPDVLKDNGHAMQLLNDLKDQWGI